MGRRRRSWVSWARPESGGRNGRDEMHDGVSRAGWGKWKSIYLIVKGRGVVHCDLTFFANRERTWLPRVGVEVVGSEGRGSTNHDGPEPAFSSPSPSLSPNTAYRPQIYKKTGGGSEKLFTYRRSDPFPSANFCNLMFSGGRLYRTEYSTLHCEHIAPSIVAAPLISWRLCLPRDLTIKDSFTFNAVSVYNRFGLLSLS